MSWISEHLETLLFGAFVAYCVALLIRLHFSAKYKKFDLLSMITRRDGSMDNSKFKTVCWFVLSIYAFVYLLHHDKSSFVTFGQWVIGFWLAHNAYMVSRSGEHDDASQLPNKDGREIDAPKPKNPLEGNMAG